MPPFYFLSISSLFHLYFLSTGTNSGNNETPLTAGDMLINSLQEQITYSQVSQVPLRRGLYLGYLKLQSSVDQLQVIVPGRIPNMFPHIKVRDNPHVSRLVSQYHHYYFYY